MKTFRQTSKQSGGLFWSGAERFSVQAIQVILNIFIARELMPMDYGLIAMLGIFMAIAQSLTDSGISTALIQKKNKTEADFSTAFYFNVLIGMAMYAALFFSASFISAFYAIPQLEAIAKVVGLNIIISSFSVVQRALLAINFNFRMLFYASFAGVMLSGIVGVYLAYSGFGVWALVVQSLISYLVCTFLLWLFSKWIPKTGFSFKSFASLFHFGSKLLLSGLLHTIYTNMYTLVIGKKFSASDLGFYNRAFSFSSVISANFTETIARVVYPVQCDLQDNDKLLADSFFKYLRQSSWVLFPLMVGLCVLAKPFVLFALTEKWLFAADLLQILSLAYMWDTIMRLNYILLNVKGRTDYTLYSELIKKCVAVAILFISIPWGIKAMCWGLLLYSFADIVIVGFYVERVLPRITVFKQIKVILPVLVLSIAMGVCVKCASFLFMAPFLQLLVGGIVGILVYGLGSRYIGFDIFRYISKKNDDEHNMCD